MWRRSDRGARTLALRYFCSDSGRQVLPGQRSQEVLAVLSRPDWIQGLESLRKSSLPENVVYEVLQSVQEWRKAFDFYRWAGSRPHYTHSFRNLRTTVSFLCRAMRYQEAYELLMDAARLGPEPDQFLCSLVMLRLSDSGQTIQAFELLKKMRSLGVVPDTRMLNIMLKGLKVDDGLWVLREFSHAASSVSCNIVMDKLSKQTRIDEARQLLLEMEAKGIKGDGFTYTTLVHGYCRLGRLDDACQVLEGMSCTPCASMYNAIIKTLCGVQSFSQAFLLVDDMAEKGCIPTVVTFGILVDGLCKANRLTDAFELVEVMGERGCFPNALVFNGIMDALCKEGRSAEAYGFIETMRSMGVSPTIVTYNLLIDGFCKEEKLHRALEILQEMTGRGHEPNHVTYNTFLHGLCKYGKVDDALALFRAMTEKKIRLDVYGYTTLIDGLCQAGKLAEAYSLLDEMENSGCVPKPGCYNAILSWLCKGSRINEAHKLFKRMTGSGILPDWESFRGVQASPGDDFQRIISQQQDLRTDEETAD
ncbi:pentatricopeptide repeat-containing protein At5g65560 [Selaginella moellendorffii]|uniref:pentatricopeptide repeat-containing protein At5g65560 n=1 Tax=Selaginella moellendorffii TaxID=88036 RepID=UPI000D1CBE03|nr:pentatricopeptide repeat-containing protein At5g65560 [Selaginella moellendorffii]|eukprot:XP_024527568.1 pentatricopeptide repeat-containing protein At5g65560 [Selaginella moellendorffii]